MVAHKKGTPPKTPSRGRSHRTRMNRVGSMIICLALAGAKWAKASKEMPRTILVDIPACSLDLNITSLKVRQYLQQMEDMLVIENLFLLRGEARVTLKDSTLLAEISKEAHTGRAIAEGTEASEPTKEVT